jgi:hypothetical protein
MENSELKTMKMSLANIEGKLSVTEMENIMAGSGGFFGCGNAYSFGCVNGVEYFFRDYNVFGIAVSTENVAAISC